MTGSVILTSLGPYINALSLQPTGGGPTQRLATITANSIAKAYIGDKFTLSFLIDGQATPSITVPKCWVKILLQGPGPSFTTYWLDQTNNWKTGTPENYNIFGNTSAAYESISISAPPMPISGTIIITWTCDNFDTLIATIANVKLTYDSPYQYRLVKNSVVDYSYQKIVEIPIGGQCNEFAPNQIGSLVKSDGSVLTGWYRYGKPTESYDDLLKLVYQNYFNIASKSSVNIQCDVMSLFSEIGDEVVPTSPFTAFEVEDGTSTQSVTGKSYVLGNASLDYTADQLTATLLETSDTDIAATITDLSILKT